MPEENTKDWPQWWHDSRGSVRVMTVCENYVMARRPRCVPFVRHVNDFKIAFKEGKK